MTEMKRLGRLIEKVEFAMLITEDADGRLHSRPMATAELDGRGQLWFLSTEDSPKVREIADRPRVNVSYSSPNEECYVSISGNAEIIRDPVRARELWSPMDEEWFPHGPDDSKLVLIRVKIDSAAYWDSLSATMTRIIAA